MRGGIIIGNGKFYSVTAEVGIWDKMRRVFVKRLRNWKVGKFDEFATYMDAEVIHDGRT